MIRIPLPVLALACAAALVAPCKAAPPVAAPAAPAASDAVPAPPASPLETAQRLRPGVHWQADSVLEGDFDCSGHVSAALLGTTAREVTLAVFTGGGAAEPVWLQFPAREIDPATVMLTAEDFDFDPAQFRRENGEMPPGLEPSTTCEGLDLSDAAPHSIHVYWHRQLHRYANWRQ